MALMAADASPLAPAAEPSSTPNPVERERVDDPITGLPLLRYRFTGAPTIRPGDPGPAGAWRVLRVREREGETVLEAETMAGAEPLDGLPEAVDDQVVELALATLTRARASGAVHGDLGPHRLWRRGEHLWIEGFGVRWRDDADPTDDARRLATGLLALTGTRISDAARARLAAVAAQVDPTAQADAAAQADPAVQIDPAAPAAVPVTGGLLDASARRRLGLALAIATIAWAALAAWIELRPGATPLATRAVERVVQVEIEPVGQPPVLLVVVESPAGSRFAAGTVLGSVPSPVMLDRDGTWRLEARFGALSSPVTEVHLPFERHLRLPFPTLPRTAAP